MDARLRYSLLLTATLMSLGASHRSKNFLVTASTSRLAQEVCVAAEQFRKQTALDWLGQELPAWPQPCPIRVNSGNHLGAGGVTSFVFSSGQPGQWQMTIQGSRQRILDSVLPHEITHTVFATHFGRPLPRWADEGACTTVEHISERTKQDQYLIRFLKTGRALPFNRMYHLKEYPHDILPLYSQGYSLSRLLIAQGGKQEFIRYLGTGMESNDWDEATRQHYGYRDLSALQLAWVDWVSKGSRLPAARTTGTTLVAGNQATGKTRLAGTTTSRDGWQPRSNARDWQRIANARAEAAEARTTTSPATKSSDLAETGGSWYRRQSTANGSSPTRLSTAAAPTRLSRPQQLVTPNRPAANQLPPPPTWSQIPQVQIPATGSPMTTATVPAIPGPAKRQSIRGPLPLMR